MLIDPKYCMRFSVDTYHFKTRYFNNDDKITLFVTSVDLEFRWFVGNKIILNDFNYKTPTMIQKFLERQLLDPLFEIEWLRELYVKYPDATC